LYYTCTADGCSQGEDGRASLGDGAPCEAYQGQGVERIALPRDEGTFYA
jgi:hypothetical protein